MNNALLVLRDAVIVAVAGAFVSGLVYIVKLLVTISRDVKSFGPSIQALYRVQPFVLDALEYQNSALREVGANGSTIKADDAVRKGRECLERMLEERVGCS